MLPFTYTLQFELGSIKQIIGKRKNFERQNIAWSCIFLSNEHQAKSMVLKFVKKIKKNLTTCNLIIDLLLNPNCYFCEHYKNLASWCLKN